MKSLAVIVLVAFASTVSADCPNLHKNIKVYQQSLRKHDLTIAPDTCKCSRDHWVCSAHKPYREDGTAVWYLVVCNGIADCKVGPKLGRK